MEGGEQGRGSVRRNGEGDWVLKVSLLIIMTNGDVDLQDLN